MNNYDELLNNYIDGDLSKEQLNQLDELMSADPKIVEKLKALKLTDKYLGEMEHNSAPVNAANRIMERISKSIAPEISKNHFFTVIMTFFALCTLGSIVFLFSFFPSSKQDYSKTENIMNELSTYITSFFNTAGGYLANTNIMLVIATVSLAIMIAVYFFIESQRVYKKNIRSVIK